MTKCDVCNCDVKDDEIHHVEIKGNVKNICKGCVAAIKGFA